MESKAILRGVRVSAIKARLVVDLIRGKDAKVALAILMFTPRKASLLVANLLKSAIANATNNFDMNEDELFVKEVYVNEGSSLKRHMFKSRGRVGMIKKPTSHITIVVAEKE